jgi:hypothetical protein
MSETANTGVYFASLRRKHGANLFYSPDRTTLVQLAFFANERGSSPFENPDVIVGGLLADNGGDHPDKAAEFNVEDIVNGPTRRAADAEGHFASGFYGDAHQPRLCGWGDKGKLCLWGGREEI